MEKNYGVCCTVEKCRHNKGGCNCELDKIRVTCCSGEKCTCCDSFEELD
jgi:hypothetical protein